MSSCFVTSVILLWATIITFSSLPWCQACSEEQKRALLEIRNSTGGFAFQGWNGRNCCEADRIYCDGARGVITEIKLVGDTWSQWSPWYPNVTLFTLFVELEFLVFHNVQIGGGLQPFCELKRLNYLRGLELTETALDGHIPPCLGMIQNIEVLLLFENHLHGNVPSSIFSNQSKIRRFDVSNNQLEGVLSFSIFANVSSLQEIGLSYNFNLEVETESSSWIPTFQLNTLWLANCSLNKRIGHSYPSFISTQVSLKTLDLSYNSMESTIPCWLLFNTSVNLLYLHGNNINGTFVDCIANQTSLVEILDISSNYISHLLPKNFGHLFPKLFFIDMSSNALEGIIPWSFGNLSLRSLDLSNNMLFGRIPQSLTRDGTQIVYLNLSNNKLQGEMLPKGSNMTSLQYLLLSNNQFEGMISPMISNSPQLKILEVRNNQLSGNIPMWLYDHPSLYAIILDGNHLEGHLLEKMCQMKWLQVFDISKNHISGGIPNCLGNITFWNKIPPNQTYIYVARGFPGGLGIAFYIGITLQMKHHIYSYMGKPLSLVTSLDLSSNQLTGSIPLELGELSQLLSINLSNNFLTGPLPDSFKNLKKIESLDLSHNMLDGKLPFGLMELTSLSTFSVAYNNLSGRIPFEGQFSTFGMQSYDGNLGLCGKPLLRNCLMTNGVDDEHREQDEEKKEENRMVDDPLLFYAFIAVSYAFGFWVFFGILIFNKNWRLTYFRCVDRYIESCHGMFLKCW